MATSKNGGSRSYLRGRIGSDVYSIGKTSKGSKQQVVRSLAESVANPRSSSQMFGRMVMSTVMQAVSALKPIIDHSFDGLPVGQPSISEFIRRNYALVKADATANPANGNSFGLVKYQEKGIRGGRYVIASGSAVLPRAISADVTAMGISLTADAHTVGDLKAALGLSAEGYLTYVIVSSTQGAQFARLRLTTNLADATEITAANAGSLFTIEANANFTVAFANNNVAVMCSNAPDDGNAGVIVSEKENGQWIHNECVLGAGNDNTYAADDALPTYPVGSQQFLNGGDL